MFAAVCVFNVSMRMCTIKNKMVEGFLENAIKKRKLAKVKVTRFTQAPLGQAAYIYCTIKCKMHID